MKQLAQVVEKFRPSILQELEPDLNTLKLMAELVELSHLEWSKVPDNDEASQKWADYLLKIAKRRGWFWLCVKNKILPERYLHWPEHNYTKPPKIKESKDKSTSVKTILGGGFETKRRKF